MEDTQEKEVQIMPEAQAQHITELVQYLTSIYNGLNSAVVDAVTADDKVLQYRLNAAAFNGVMDSLHTTANNLAKMIGAEVSTVSSVSTVTADDIPEDEEDFDYVAEAHADE